MEKITTEMYAQLKAPLPSEAVKPHPTKSYLSSIKAIFVTERLNDVFGCGAWTIKTQEISVWDKGMVVVKVTLEIPLYWVYYESFGGNDNWGEKSANFDLGDAYKGATTDAITKIASYMGIAMEVFKGHGNSGWNNAPIRDDVPQTTKVYPKSALDEVMEQMEVENDIEHLKTLYALGLDRVKSDKQKAFFDSFKEKQKKRILALNIHTA